MQGFEQDRVWWIGVWEGPFWLLCREGLEMLETGSHREGDHLRGLQLPVGKTRRLHDMGVWH